jgi:GTP-binding protein LepA
VETIFRVINGSIKAAHQICRYGESYYADEIGTLKLTRVPKQEIKAGDMGYLITGIKREAKSKVGDTITDHDTPTNPYWWF